MLPEDRWRHPNNSGRDVCSQTGIETCRKQNPGGHPRGGVRGLESIGTPSSAPLSGDTQPMWRMEEEGSPRLEV